MPYMEVNTSIYGMIPYMAYTEVNTSIHGMTCMIDGNFGNVSAGVLFYESRVSTKTVVRICPRLGIFAY